jgi:tRNA 2-thiouridine synthesizing protein A
VVELDLTGLVCPMPLIKLKKALVTGADAGVFRVLVSDRGGLKDIPAFCAQQGLSCELVAQDKCIEFRVARVN